MQRRRKTEKGKEENIWRRKVFCLHRRRMRRKKFGVYFYAEEKKNGKGGKHHRVGKIVPYGRVEGHQRLYKR